MSVFDINRAPLRQVYHVSGIAIDSACDVGGEEVFNLSDLVVMSYNIQKFDGINSQQALQAEIMSLWKPDIIGLQEFPNTSPLPSIVQAMLSGHTTYNVDALAFGSKCSLSNVVSEEFENQDPAEISQWGSTRKYLKGYLQVNDKTVCIINTHLAVLTSSYRYAQMRELLDLVSSETYLILMGDFNMSGVSISSDDYINMYKPFVDAGYHLANCTLDAGFNKTYTSATYATEQINLITCPDNIITSENIDMLDIGYDLTKFNYLNGTAIDHIPIIAYLKIN